MRQDDRTAIREAELIASEGRNSPGISDRGMIEVVARIEGGVPQELEKRSVEPTAAGARDDVRESGGAATNLRRHPAGGRADLFDSVDVEVAEGRAPISGSLVSAPSMAKAASTPRWPLMENCCVKFVWPLASVMVPAASSNNWLKSRLFSGIALTVWPESFSPPVFAASSEANEIERVPCLERITTPGGDSTDSSRGSV
jgi:hypothetical protein